MPLKNISDAIGKIIVLLDAELSTIIIDAHVEASNVVLEFITSIDVA
jgi:hypothetical protein